MVEKAKPTVVVLTTKKAIEAAIDHIHRTGASLQMDMHQAAVSVLAHLAKHGDIRMVSKLLNAMPESSRTNSLRKWFEHFGAVAFTGNEPVYVKSKATKLGEAMNKPFWKFAASEGTAYEPLDINAEIGKLMKRIENDAKKTNRDHGQYIGVLAGLTKPVALAA